MQRLGFLPAISRKTGVPFASHPTTQAIRAMKKVTKSNPSARAIVTPIMNTL